MATSYQEAVEKTIIASEQLNQIVNGTAVTEVVVEDGSKIPSIRKALVDNFYFKDPLPWQQGQSETVFNQLRKFSDGTLWYAPTATASHVIPMGATPIGDPLWKVYSLDAIPKLTPQIREALRRTYAEAGLVLVDGSFEDGAKVTTKQDVVLERKTGKCYSWDGDIPVGGKVIPVGSTPDSTGGIGQYKWLSESGTILRAALIKPSGAGLIGTASGDTVQEQLTGIASEVIALRYAGITVDSPDNKAAIADIKNNAGVKYPLDGGFKQVLSSAFTDIDYLKDTIVKSGEFTRVPNITPDKFGGMYTHQLLGGGQLSSISEAISSAFYQELGITFIGDSITWGTGSTGQSSSSLPRDGTLSDSRNNKDSCSYVNEMCRWIAKEVGTGAVVSYSNHPYSTEGESIMIVRKDEYVFPKGKEFSFAREGVASSVIKDSLAGPFLNARREITVNNGGRGSLAFRMTGTSFTVIFGGLSNGAQYEVWINGRIKGTYSTRVGDDGVLAANNQRRKHSFDYINGGSVAIVVKQYGNETSNNAMYLEGLLFERVVTVKNQGIIGATTASYKTYNFPTTVLEGKIQRLPSMPSWTETRVGTGATSLTVVSDSNSLTGEQRRYGFIPSSGWELSFTIPAGKDTVLIGYSSLPNTCAVEVYANDVLAGTIHTSDLYPGNTTGYAKIAEIAVPTSTTSIKLKTVYEALGGGSTSYLYLEGVGYRDSQEVSYPINNGFNDGVCLDMKDCFAFIQLGTNDRAGNRIKAKEEISANIEDMLGLLPQGCLPILMVSPKAETTSSHAFTSVQVRSAILKVARANKVDFIDNYTLFGDCPLQYYTTDNLHPNDKGHALIAKNIIHAITSACQ